MKGIVDRFESNKVLVEIDDEIKVYDRSMFPEDLKEGDCVSFRDGKFVVDEDLTKRRKKDIESLFNSLLDKDE